MSTSNEEVVSDRTYGQYCGLARALDLVGERWALLVVRELLLGPKRFTDLLAGLPGVSTNVLANRLRQLERAGVVGRATLPPPAASAVYELTPYGRALEPAVAALGRWGAASLGERAPGQVLRSHWLALALKAFFHPEQADGAARVYEVRLREGAFRLAVTDGTLDVVPGPAADPDLVLAADDDLLVGVLAGLVEPAALTVVSGDPAEVPRFVALFRFAA
ncbi:MAG TPA: winged helix-turn-helix transcriptional regulator [Gaiellaceae bacterium]|nr:winged helix-turn-helix transcriptional regulator [Gaiellaceae bacterium]